MIQSLNLSGFTNFSENHFDFCQGINLFIGRNGTGKTHLLKIQSALLKSLEQQNGNGSKERLENTLGDKLLGYFRPEQLGRLVKRIQGRTKARIGIRFGEKELVFGFSNNSKNTVGIERFETMPHISSLYLPSREIISVFEGFISLYQKRETSFDETYYQLALALDANLLRGPRFDEVKQLIEPLEAITESKVVKENGRFYLRNQQGKIEMPLVAEGLRKIATLMFLIANGELARNSVLFWDEPEANLNPKLVSRMADLLLLLAGNGVQIFIASHDYLLTQLLSLKAEYRQENTPPVKFFCLDKTADGNIEVEEGDTLAEIGKNPILEEFAAYYDREQSFFNLSLQS
jgi:predicted ATPase